MANTNHKRRIVTRLLTPVALAVTLAACSSAPKAPQSVDITLDPNQPMQTYLMRADSSQGALQNDWLIMALKASVEAGDATQAQLLIKRLARQSLNEMQQAEWQLAQAELLVAQEQYTQALETLNFQPSWQLVDAQWLSYHQLRADLFNQQNDLINAARETSLASRYQDQAAQALSSEVIWSNLSPYSASALQQYQAQETNRRFYAWLELAALSKGLANNLPQLKTSIEQWLAENPTHPAAVDTPQALLDILALEITKPVNTALLLPLSGKFAKQAQLIRDGFILEMMNDQARDTEATLTVIDTNTISIEELEATLVEKQIDSIVGPLLKENIEKLQAAQASFTQSLPTLALNIPEEIQAGNNTCYLALSPEQEVAQAAKHLAKQGYQYPLILAPQGRLGSRVVEAFEQEWQKYSDNQVAVNLFGDKRQLQRDINKVFGLQSSQQNIAQMEALLDIPLESQPRSRRDIDAVYIVAKSSELTLIKPFIEVAINPDTLPPKLYSNSRSNSGRQQYEDLSGVMYSDIPLLIQPNDALQAQMDTLWPKDSNAEKRLQALGMDAYRLMEHLPQMKVVNGYTVDGNTGVLSIDQNCIVQRELSWAEHSAQ
ncbi:penicillin-binding protein activator [Vibrio sinaloensis]|uniref:penicillin-binding protein activator n=1 Tax=Photobacterium sp. (strain ATCC 43367) TaxID=379097 RepID=UPI00204FF546|nr:penicillin-binding protein activator [Vibrio sinaloensis]UPQ88464.1 penicillin-binding protein activator [Vibrio sinaloensis]